MNKIFSLLFSALFLLALPAHAEINGADAAKFIKKTTAAPVNATKASPLPLLSEFISPANY